MAQLRLKRARRRVLHGEQPIRTRIRSPKAHRSDSGRSTVNGQFGMLRCPLKFGAPALGPLPRCCGLGAVPNHPDEGDDANCNHNWIEGMSGHRHPRIRKMTNQHKWEDCPDACTRSAQAAHRRDRLARKEVRRQHVRYRCKTGVRKCGKPEERGDQVQVDRKNCRDQRSTPVPPKTTSALRAVPSDHPRLSNIRRLRRRFAERGLVVEYLYIHSVIPLLGGRNLADPSV